MKKVFIVFKLNTWAEPATWDVYRVYEDEKAAEAFYYKDWPRNSGRYRLGTWEISK